MIFTPEQYITGIRCCLAQRRHLCLTIDHSTFGEDSDIPTVGRSVGAPLPVLDIIAPKGAGDDFIVVRCVTPTGGLWSVILDGSEQEDFELLFETVYNWDNTPYDLVPEAWLEELFKEENEYLRAFLNEGNIVESELIVVGIDFEPEQRAGDIHIMPVGEYRREKTGDEAEDYSWVVLKEYRDGKGNPSVAVYDNISGDINHRKPVKKSLGKHIKDLPENNSYRLLYEFFKRQQITLHALCETTHFYKDPNEW